MSARLPATTATYQVMAKPSEATIAELFRRLRLELLATRRIAKISFDYSTQAISAGSQVEQLQTLTERVKALLSETIGYYAPASDSKTNEVAEAGRMVLQQVKEGDANLKAGLARESSLANVAPLVDALLFKIDRALMVAESAIRESEDLPACAGRRQIADTLEIRRLFATFWLLTKRSEVFDEDLEMRLILAFDRLADLSASEIYPLLRFQDRLLIRSLRERINSWLAEPAANPQKPAQGARIWSDLADFGETFRALNELPEVRTHDLELVSRLFVAFFESPDPPESFEKQVRPLIDSLFGRHADLDALILPRVGLEREPLRAALTALRAELQKDQGQTKALTSANIGLEGALASLMQLRGIFAAGFGDLQVDRCLDQASRRHGFDAGRALLSYGELLRTHQNAERNAGAAPGDAIQEIVVNLEKEYHILLIVPEAALSLFTAFRRDQINLALTRYKLDAIVETLRPIAV